MSEFSASLVSKRFGTWNNALIEAGIPLRVQPRKEVNCALCGLAFMKRAKEIKKTSNDFCSQSCAAIYTNAGRRHNDKTKDKISKGVKKYNKANAFVKICKVCGDEHIRTQSDYCKQSCYFRDFPSMCSICGIAFKGYIQHIVKDMGKFNEMFVYREFHSLIFRFFIHFEIKMSADF